jgi:nickel/cobalt transporter (NicO) family protein
MHRLFATFVVLGILLGRPVPAGAHRLDEYLQATRLSIDVDRVSLEIDLTAGVNVAPQVVAWIDTNRDGQISSSEAHAYAQQMLRAVVLSVDGRTASLTLLDSRFPEARNMTAGVGTIRLRATANLPTTGSGRHQLVYVNDHRSEMSVYLVNALVPNDARIQIASQRRDPAQHRLTVDYDAAVQSRWSRASWLLAGLAIIGLLAVTRRPRR